MRKLAALAALVPLLVVPGAEASTRALGAEKTEPAYLQLLGASPSGALYVLVAADRREDLSPPGRGPTYLKATGKPAVVVSSGYDALVGDRLYDLQGSTVVYRTVASATTQSCPTGVGTAFTATGWVSRVEGRYVVTTAGATGCTTRDVGLVDSDGVVAADTNGFLVSAFAVGGPRFLKHVSLADPPVVTDIPLTGVEGAYLENVTLVGNQVGFSVGNGSSDGLQPSPAAWVYRTSLAGGTPQETPLDYVVQRVAITPTQTAWSTNRDWGGRPYDAVGSIAVGSGAQQVAPGSASVVASGADLYLDAQTPSPGIYRATTATSARTVVADVGKLPPIPSSVAVAAGRVGVADTFGAPASTVRVRQFHSSAIAQSLLVAGARDVEVDGVRAAYVRDGALWVKREGLVEAQVFAPAASVAQVADRRPQLSGSRLLWFRGDYSGDECDPSPICAPAYRDVVAVLTDLRTSVSTDLGPAVTDRWALWGSFVVRGNAAGRITRTDLSSKKVVVTRTSGDPVSSVAVHGGYVAWSTCRATSVDPCAVSTVGYRDGGAVRPAVTRASVRSTEVRASGGLLAFASGTSPRTLRTWRLGTSATTALVTVATLKPYVPFGPPVRDFDVDDDDLVWIGSDSTARLGEAAPFVERPRYLGNAVGDFSLARGTQDWEPELPVSKPLTTCSVVIRSPQTGRVMRRLACASNASSVFVRWDGRLDNGELLPAATWKWTLEGGDADGSVLWWTGSSVPVSGTVTFS